MKEGLAKLGQANEAVAKVGRGQCRNSCWPKSVVAKVGRRGVRGCRVSGLGGPGLGDPGAGGSRGWGGLEFGAWGSGLGVRGGRSHAHTEPNSVVPNSVIAFWVKVLGSMFGAKRELAKKGHSQMNKQKKHNRDIKKNMG